MSAKLHRPVELSRCFEMAKIAILGIAHMHGYSYVRALKRMNDIEIAGLYDEDRSRMNKACEDPA